jgi:hypothetical protein
MPKFIDYHASMPQMPPEAVQQMTGLIKEGRPDEFGVRPLNVYMGTGGQAYCLTEAPDAEAVIRAHEAKGSSMNRAEVVEVTSLV